MKKLPPEILDEIFSNLHSNQKRECMLVCGQSATILRSGSLLNTVNLHKQGLVHGFIDMLEQHPHQGTQLRHLVTSSQRKLSLKINRLCRLLPNIKSIYIHWALLPVREKETEIEDLSTWHDQLEVLKEYNQCTFTFHLLGSGIWTKLSTLVVNCHFIGIRVFKILSNAPHLIHLTLMRCQVTSELLDKLHSDLERLASLTLKDVYLSQAIGYDSYQPAASSITYFSISFRFACTEAPVKILEYARKKYISLSQLDFDCDWREDLIKPNGLQIVRDGILPILENLGHQLTSLNIGGAIIKQDFFRSLHSLGFHNLELKIISNFSLFKHFNFTRYETWKLIRELTIDVMFDSHITSLAYLEMLLMLKIKYRKVFIEYGGLEDPTFDLSDLFELCPISLQELQIVGFQMNCSIPPGKKLDIKKLEISSPYLDQDVYKYIATYLPKLRFLTLKYEYPTEDFITLENLYLSVLSIEAKTNGHIEVTTLAKKERLYYPLISQLEHVHLFDDKRTAREYGSVKNIPENSLRVPSLIKLVCGSVNTLILNRHVAF